MSRTETKAAIWGVLEPKLESYIHLDLNDPDECQAFVDLVMELTEAVTRDDN